MALTGIRILDLSGLLPGPFATQLLADLGAEVIKIESPKGDFTRGRPNAFTALNRGKKSVILDLKKSSQLNQLFNLMETSDVLVEGFRPGVLERLLKINKLSILNKRYPRLIICRISGYGQTGALRLVAGHDNNYLSKFGILSLMKRPELLPVQVADIAGGSWPAAFQIVSALYQRERTGTGSCIDVAMADGALSLLVMDQADYAGVGRKISKGRSPLVGAFPCYQIYQCQDGFISVGSLEPHFWQRFCKGLKRLDFINRINDPTLIIELQQIFLTKPMLHWQILFIPLDCCVEVIRNIEEVLSEESQIISRKLLINVNSGKNSLQLLKTPLTMTPGIISNNQRALKFLLFFIL